MYLLSLMDLHPDIFDDITVTPLLDKQTMIDTIVLKAATYDVLHHSFPLAKSMNTIWFKAHYEQFDRLAKAAATEYDLIQNYDRTREYSRKVKRDENKQTIQLIRTASAHLIRQVLARKARPSVREIAIAKATKMKR